MPMYNLIEHSSNYSETAGRLWFYFTNTDNFKTFKYKAKSLENTVAQPAPNAANGILRNAAIAVLLKYSGNFGR